MKTIFKDEGRSRAIPEARTQLERALELHRRALGANNPNAIKTMSRPERTELQGKYYEADALLSRTLEIQGRVLGPEHPNTVGFHEQSGQRLPPAGKYAQAEALHSQTLEIRRRWLGPEHPDTLQPMNNLASVYYLRDKYAHAEGLFSKTLENSRRVLGPEHPFVLSSLADFASMYQRQGRYALASRIVGTVCHRLVHGPATGFGKLPRFSTDKSFRLYRECAGAVRLESKMRLIAGAFPIRRLGLSR